MTVNPFVSLFINVINVLFYIITYIYNINNNDCHCSKGIPSSRLPSKPSIMLHNFVAWDLYIKYIYIYIYIYIYFIDFYFERKKIRVNFVRSKYD